MILPAVARAGGGFQPKCEPAGVECAPPQVRMPEGGSAAERRENHMKEGRE